MKPITKIKPVYPVVTETVEYAAVGAAARDLSFLFPAMLIRSDQPAVQLFVALTQYRDQAAKERKDAKQPTLLQSRYLAMREEVLSKVVDDLLKAKRESRLDALLKVYRSYLDSIVATSAKILPAAAPRLPVGNQSWLLEFDGAPEQSHVDRLFQLYTSEHGHYLGMNAAA
ncbi:MULTISPECIES: hypothetical protein [Xanthomonas]|uniref:Uncharacterized protein n=3 Tax=Xanthomonas TaxID=338 RepID=A0AAJ0J2R6_9XANT|nr:MULTISPECIES: hypothetical protein [Xanthomonas]MBD5077988.1 hypothetical protein [Xanthomonas citri pv. citri]MEB1846204.1 hypothetical protein [Xanthomonas campestris pv. campestris]APO97783.1 hypothetical protein BJD13_00930 [Xanthomonas perforans]APP78139.1 hypothetical protein BJD12_22660 [Xanthomonas vesicatoria ATCC 35937]APP87324.1 hypothetical protein BI317_25010 [Xanthomonas hortorum pv. gardneri]